MTLLLQLYLNKHNLTQSEFARRCKGVLQNEINHYVRGKRTPTPTKAKAIFEATFGEISVMDLLFPTDFQETEKGAA